MNRGEFGGGSIRRPLQPSLGSCNEISVGVERVIRNTLCLSGGRGSAEESAKIRTNMQEHSVFLMEGRFISLCVFLSL